MPDPLYAAIAGAIRQPLDGDAFERCALDLLRSAYYPNLRPIPPGRDAGMDGVAGPDGEPDFVLVATTAKDYRRNLRESVLRHLDAGGEGRAFVFATTREVTGESRLRLIRDANEQWGVELRAIHDRGEFEQLLYRSTRWREELLGVTRSASALSRFPASARASAPLPPIGRDAELERLRAADGDVLLAGAPGVGKTFLLERLADEHWGLFDLGWSVPGLKDAILETRPLRVMLDDAHLSPDRLDAVRRLRREMEAGFGIVAVSWPGRAGEVAARLPDAERIDIEELERDRIVEVIGAAGVADAELQRLIADQADGRAGLAAALARACAAGRTREVATGEALLADLAGWCERTLGAKSRRVLGVLALAGDAGATTEQVGEALRLDLAETGGLIAGLASGGALGEARGRRMNVQPPDLRYPLVRDVFYGSGSLDPERVVAAFGDPSSAALPLIGAAHRGASVERGWLRELIDWRDERAAVEYAVLGPGELREALERAPGAWAGAASAELGLGAREADEWAAERRAAIAGAAYRLGVDAEYALRVLMETAVVCESLDTGIADPLDVVRQRLASFGAGLDERRAAIGVASQWLRDGGDAHAGVRVLTHAVQPELSDASTDPGLGRTLTLRSAVVPLSWIEPLSEFWDAILGAAEHRPDIPIEPLAAALGPWARPEILPRRSRPGERHALPEAAARAMRATAARAIGRLAGIFRERPGALRRLSVLARQGEIDADIDLPEDFAALYPVRDPFDAIGSVAEWEDWDRRWIEAVGRVADTLAERPVAEAAARLAFLAREADEAGIRSPPGARRLAQALAERAAEPETLLDALIEAGAGADLIAAPLDRVAEHRRPGWEAAIGRVLGNEATATAAIRVALLRPVGERLKRLAIREAAPWPGLVRDLVGRDEADQATLSLLFEAPDPEIARTAALELGTPPSAERLASLPPEMRARWREIVVGCPVPDGDGFAGWALGEIMERDSAICADWVRAWFGRRRNDGGRHEDTTDVQAAIGNLPADVRTALIADVPHDAPAFALQDIVQRLVAGNVAAAAALFGRPEYERLHRLALKGDVGEEWMERALLALEHGWTPESVVAAQRGSIEGPYGSESRHWQERIESFGRLRPAPGQPDAGPRTRIAEAGLARYEEQRDAALRRERDERVHGSR